MLGMQNFLFADFDIFTYKNAALCKFFVYSRCLFTAKNVFLRLKSSYIGVSIFSLINLNNRKMLHFVMAGNVLFCFFLESNISSVPIFSI
jgi:hypothetical protein